MAERLNLERPWLYDVEGKVLTGTQFSMALELVYECAHLIKDGEPLEDGSECDMEGDVAYDTLHMLISSARAIYGMPHRLEKAPARVEAPRSS